MLGVPELLVIGSAIVLVVYRSRLPKLFVEMGKGVRLFREELKEEDTRPIREVDELKAPGRINPRATGSKPIDIEEGRT